MSLIQKATAQLLPNLNVRDYVPNRRSVFIENFASIGTSATQSGQTSRALGNMTQVTDGGGNPGADNWSFAVPLLTRGFAGPYFARCLWWTNVTGTGTVEFDIALLTLGDGDILSGQTLTFATVTDNATATDDYHMTDWSSELTVTGTPADGDVLWMTVRWDHASSSFASLTVDIARVELSYIANDLRGPEPS